MQCFECGSPMEISNGVWACSTCFSVSLGEGLDDNTLIEEDLTLREVLPESNEQE